MRCDDAKAYFADALAGSTRPARDFDAHLAVCPDCRAELEKMQSLWAQLGELPSEEPTPALRRNFYEMLDRARAEQATRPANRFKALMRSAFFVPAAAAACLLVGLFAGYMTSRPAKSDTELAQLRGEVASLRQVVALSLLQNQSASDRLRGVTYSNEMGQANSDVLAALIDRLNYDSNVNVRLAAVDALQRFGRDAVVRQGLRESLPRQQSPLVQIALIELLAEWKDPQAAPVVQSLARQESLNPAVRQRAERALTRFE
jgi:HEAT repeat protein